MRSFIVIVAMLALCWIFTDVRSDNALFNVLAPLGAVVFTVALLIWGVFAVAARRESNSGPPPTPDFFDSGRGPEGSPD
jgi:apolipoprotein N-acyltransferase